VIPNLTEITDRWDANKQQINEAVNQLHNEDEVGVEALCYLHTGIANAVVVCHYLACRSGWWVEKDGSPVDMKNPYVFATKMALIHSEVSEAMEGGRKNLPDSHLPHRLSVEVELADVVIRVFDTAGAMGLDLAGAVIEKLAYNQRREDHKPDVRKGQNGKAF